MKNESLVSDRVKRGRETKKKQEREVNEVLYTVIEVDSKKT